MKKTLTTVKDYALPGFIIASFVAYYYDLFHDGMVTSGIIAIIVTLYIGILWHEGIHDERDEYIRSKVDRVLYIVTCVLLLFDIIHKTFAHVSYMSELSILTILATLKVILSKIVRSTS